MKQKAKCYEQAVPCQIFQGSTREVLTLWLLFFQQKQHLMHMSIYEKYDKNSSASHHENTPI